MNKSIKVKRMSMNDIDKVIEMMTESIEMEGNVSEEILIDKLKEIYDFLYINNGNDYYLINYDKWFDLLNRYRDKINKDE